MAYQKQIWENLPSQNTPLSADRLNHMEDGIAEAWEHGGGGGGGIDIGTIVPFSGSTSAIPNGFMLCDGSAISRTTYATLFSIIGTTYGEGDGSTTFNIPDLQGRTLVGVDSEDTDFDVLGETGGSKYLQKHKHAVDWSLSVGNAEGRVILGSGSGGSSTGQYGYAANDNIDVTTGNSGNLQPYITINYIIKVLNSQSGDIRSESLPVGSEIEFDGDSQDIPTGWEQVEGKTYLGTVLYNDTTGTTGNVTLSDSSANYNYMEIYFRTNDGTGYMGCQKVYNPDAKKTCLIYWHITTGAYNYIKAKNITISGTSITSDSAVEVELSSATPSSRNANNIYIARIVGYKEV